jgi:hypothetical protein
MSTASHEFWVENEEYHEVAETYDRHVMVTSPDPYRGVRGVPDSWERTGVKYYEYKGPSVVPTG